MTPAIPASSIRLGRITVLPGERKVLLDDEPARLGSRAFDLLNALVARRGKILAKRELLDLVWPGIVVEENNLQVQICALRKLLGPQAIVTVPGRGYTFSSGVDVQEAQGVPAAARRPHQPASTAPLRGRDTQVAALLQLMQAHRLVTVSGPGGVGKTRLVQAAITRAPLTPDTVAVELAGVPQSASVASFVARALRLNFLRPASARQLAGALGRTNVLLVMENAEHVLDQAGELAEALLEHTAGVRLVCTSQSPLRSRGEHVLRLPPLDLPAGEDAPDVRENPSMLLLLDSICARQPRAAFEGPELHEAVSICRHLDGVPLALELAGSRVPLLGLGGVRRHLTDRFRLLAVEARGAVARQRSLRASMEWSWSLLGPREQAALVALSRHQGRFTLGAVKHALRSLAGNEWEAMEVLGELVDKSMVLAESGSRSAFRLLETMRLFAQEQGARQAAGHPPSG